MAGSNISARLQGTHIQAPENGEVVMRQAIKNLPIKYILGVEPITKRPKNVQTHDFGLGAGFNKYRRHRRARIGCLGTTDNTADID